MCIRSATFWHRWLLILAIPLTAPTIAEEPVHDHALLTIRAILVGQNLELKPVAKREFWICPTQECTERTSVVTSFGGEATADLPAGDYWVRIAEGLTFEEHVYLWVRPVGLKAGEAQMLELSNDNALVVEVSGERPLKGPTDEGKLYRRFKDGVFKVLAEGGHGSGFLVDASGLILTNAHVVGESPFLAVKVDETRKYPAQLVSADTTNDLAVIRVVPEAVVGMPVLPLADDHPDRAPVAVGERVVAIGSPLTTETILTSGLISKIEEGAYFSDVNINPGNSGGPLLDMTGNVIGVNTFGVSTERGPGVSGIVRIHLASRLVDEARSKAATMASPPHTRLPVEPGFRFPAAVLAEEAKQGGSRNLQQYHLETGPLDIQLMTPVLVKSLQVKEREEQAATQRKRSKKADQKTYTSGVDFYEWQRYVGDYRAVVTIQAVPEIKMTGGSVFAVIMLGASAHQKYRFKTDFERMELLRDGVRVEPIHPGRLPHSVNMAAGVVSMKDMTFFGAYEYPPEAFRPGARVELQVWHSTSREPKSKAIPPEQLAQVWADFRAYFDALESEAKGGS